MGREINIYEVLRRPLITEKMTSLRGQNKYAFEVDPDANKIQIRQAVEKIFNVKVAAVNTVKIKGERKRARAGYYTTPPIKKAIVTLKEGYKIEFFEGV